MTQEKISLESLNERLEHLERFLNGTVLRDKTVSKAGKSSAVIFIPKFFLGQKVRVAITPENSEVLGLRESIDKRNKRIYELTQENKKLESRESEKVDEVKGEVIEDKDFEGEDEY